MLQQVDATSDAGPDARETTSLSEWAFYLPSLVVAMSYALLPAGGLRAAVPFALPVAVLAYAAYLLPGRLFAAVNWHVVLAVFAICVLSCASLLVNGGIVDYFTLRKITLPISCLAIGLFRYRTSTRGMMVFATALFLIAVTNPESASDLDAPYLSENTFGSTYSNTESVYAITFACFAVYLCAKGRPVLGILALVAAVILYKRFAALSAVVAIGIYYLTPAKLSASSAFRSWATTLMFAACALASLYMTGLLEFIANRFLSGIDIAELSSGRSYLYAEIYDRMRDFDLIQYILGSGPGAVERHLDGGAFLSGINLAHNEYLSILFDFGIVGLGSCLAALVAVASRSRARFHIVTFLLVLALFENFVLINVVLMTIVFTLVSTADGDARG